MKKLEWIIVQILRGLPIAVIGVVAWAVGVYYRMPGGERQLFVYIWQIITNNKALFALAFTAFVRIMPVPGTPFRPYEILYDWLHQYLNVTNTRLSNATIPSPPLNNSVISASWKTY